MSYGRNDQDGDRYNSGRYSSQYGGAPASRQTGPPPGYGGDRGGRGGGGDSRPMGSGHGAYRDDRSGYRGGGDGGNYDNSRDAPRGQYDAPPRAPLSPVAERRGGSSFDDRESRGNFLPPPLSPIRPPTAHSLSGGSSSSGSRLKTPSTHNTLASPIKMASNSNTADKLSVDPVKVAEQLEALQLTSFYVRPGFGKEGREIKVSSNYFAVRATDGRGKIIFHYDVDIVPVVKVSSQKQPRGLLRAVWEQFVLDQNSDEWAPCIAASAFDGRRNVFSPIKFPIQHGELVTLSTALNLNREVARPNKDESSSDDEFRRWRLTFKLVAKIDLEFVMEFCRADKNTPHSEEASLTGLMCTNVLLRDFPSKRYAQVGSAGNKFFSLEGARPIAQGAVVCRGFLQSFRHSNSGFPLINIDLGFSAFLSSGPALEVIGRILQSGPAGLSRAGPGAPAEYDTLTGTQIGILKRKLRGAKSARLHTLITVTLKKAVEIVFELESDGASRRSNVPDYYKEYYGVAVRKPRLPCIQYGKHAYIPLEFVRFADFNSLPPTNLTAEQTADMIKVAAIKPDARAAAVMMWRKELDYENQKKIAAWGLQVNKQMVEVNARVLQAPNIHTATFGVDIGNRQPPLIPPTDPRNPQNLIGSLKQAAREAYMVDKHTPQLILVILPGNEIIVEFSDMIEEHLKFFAQHNNGELPERILLFRDGISEGQYSAAMQYEHDAITKACARIQPNYRPRILICVCAKRHNTRFFAKEPRDVDSRTGNLPAGLVVDRTVTHPYAFDFFLQAHAGLVGTARPTHYICLLDELGLTPDQLQKLVHGLCHTFARCTSSVSLVPVCYMADLICPKARVVVQKGEGGSSPSMTSGTRSNAPGGRDSRTYDTVSQLSTPKFMEKIDVNLLQKILSLNLELSQVAWWM